jgi:predicted nucleotidyltransferase
LLSINYRIAHEKIKTLEKEGLIKTEKAGKALLCSLAKKYDEKIYLAENLRRKELLKNKDFEIILKRFKEAKQNYILLLFGSYAKRTQTKHSDIDLLAITENDKEIIEISETIPKKIHLTTTTYKNFINMIKLKDINVGNEAQKNNIILIGIEEYHRLIENAN